MKIPYLIVVVQCALLFGSCGNQPKYTEQVNSLDSLRIELDKNLAVFSSIDTAKISRYAKTYSGNVSWIEQNIKDTVSKEYLNELKNYRGVDEPLLVIKENYANMIKDDKLSKQKFRKLSTPRKNKASNDKKTYND